MPTPATVSAQRTHVDGTGAISGRATLQRLRADRVARERHFPGLPDAAWDMLIDLALNAALERRVSITSACLGAFVPSTTGLRHIGLLVGEGLAFRVADTDDARRCWLELTDIGQSALSDFLANPPNHHADQNSLPPARGGVQSVGEPS